VKELIADPDSGKAFSASRAPMIGVGVLLMLIWLGVGVGVAFAEFEWSQFGGWMDWGKNFFYGTVAGFIGGKAVGKIKNGK
jgi:hypothetical protein